MCTDPEPVPPSECRYLRITSAERYVMIYEVQAFETLADAEVVALNPTDVINQGLIPREGADMSTVYENCAADFGGSKCVDRTRGSFCANPSCTDVGTECDQSSMCLSNGPKVGDYLQVTYPLARTKSIGAVVIWGRSGYNINRPEYLQSAKLEFFTDVGGNSPCFKSITLPSLIRGPVVCDLASENPACKVFGSEYNPVTDCPGNDVGGSCS